MMFAPRPKGLGKDNFLKLGDKEEVTGLFRGEIYSYRHHWQNRRGVECIGPDCQYCKETTEEGKPNYPRFRFRVNFVTTKDGKWVAKIYEGGGEIYDQLVSLDRKFDLSKTVIDISRSGTGANTKYNIIPRLDIPLNDEMKKQLEAVELLPLTSEAVEQEAAS